MQQQRLPRLLGIAYRLCIAGFLLVVAAPANAKVQEQEIDKCSDVLMDFYTMHAEPPVKAFHKQMLPVGLAYTWSDGAGDWVVAFLLPGWEIRPQRWGHGFSVMGTCVEGKTLFNVWFAKYSPDAA